MFPTFAKTVLQGFKRLLYPGACLVCERILQEEENSFCTPCRLAILTDPHFTCPRCSSSVGQYEDVSNGCLRCQNQSLYFDEAMRLGVYADTLRDAVLKMKVRVGELLAESMGSLWAEAARERFLRFAAQVIIPIPLHWSRRWQRGYNQSEALAEGIAGQLQVPMKSRWLKRCRATTKQTLLTPAQRQQNVKGIFRVSGRAAVKGKTVLLIDDVLTTGSTMSEAARVLKQAGAKMVVAAVLAHR